MEVTQPEGCVLTLQQEIAELCEPAVQLPTAFSPNGDGLNDRFQLPPGDWQRLRVRIYDRHGQLVYDQPRLDWDGARAPEGIYLWQLQGTTARGRRLQLSGTVTLLR